MSVEPIRVSVPYDPSSYAACTQFMVRGMYVKLMLYWAAFMAVILGYSAYRGQQPDWRAYAYSFGGVGVFMGLMSSRRFLAWRQRRSQKHLSVEDLSTTWEITREDLGYKTGTSQGSFKWKQLCRVVRIPEGFLLSPQKELFYWIPLTGFATAERAEAFASLARERCPLYSDKRESFLTFSL